jgi:xanthine dehydrogenase accessory factor
VIQIYQALAQIEAKNEAAVLCTIIRSQGSTPRHATSKMIVYPDGQILGSVGGGEVESRVIAEAQKALTDGKPRLLEYQMSDPARGDPGVCGGQLEVFVEPILPKPVLMVIGAGHVGRAVAHLGRWLDFHIVVWDDRPGFATPASMPDGHEFISAPLAELPALYKITPWTYLVLTTRGMDVDVAGLPALLKTSAAFIGVIGSRRRWAATQKRLIEQGFREEELGRVHSPIGLELNAETPEEIAVSILAEIIMIRNGGDGKIMKSPMHQPGS